MAATLFSVIVPVYNAMRTIDLCLSSLLSQRDVSGSVEIILVDDCSTDATADHLERAIAALPAGAPPVRLLRLPRNRGPAAARNAGAHAARGEILLFTDADCEVDRRWLAEMTGPLADPAVSAVKGAYRTRQQSLTARFAQAEFEDRYRLLARHEYVDVVFSYSAAIRKAVFDAVGGFDTSFPKADNEDTDLSWKISESGHRIKFAPGAIVYHQHPDTPRSYLKKKFSRAYWRACVYRRFPGKAVKDSYTPQGLKLQILLAGLMAASLLAALPWPRLGLPAFGLFSLAFLLTTLPFVAGLANRRLDLVLTAPVFMLLRALFMGAGLVWVIPRLLRSDPLAAP